MTESEPTPIRPLLRVVKGAPSPEEVAALVAVLTARAAAGGDLPAGAPSAYADPAAAHRGPLRVGPDAWQASGWVPGTRTRADW